MNEPTVWAWSDDDSSKGGLVCTIDYKATTIETFRLMGPERIDRGSGELVINAKRHGLRRIESFACLNCSSLVRVLHHKYAQKLIEFVTPREAQLFQVTVKARDGISTAFDAVIPLHSKKCTLIDKSVITHWIDEGEIALEYARLEFDAGCLGSLHMVRDTVTNLVLVSDKLREAMLSWGKLPGLKFALGRDVKTWPFDTLA